METLDRKLRLTRWHFLMAVMVLASITVTPLSAQVGLDVGQKAPDFSATGLDGKTHRLSTVTAATSLPSCRSGPLGARLALARFPGSRLYPAS
jgi:hypothetical protein